MKKVLKLFLLLVISNSYSCYSQKLTDFQLESRLKADSVAKSYLKIQDKSFLLFSITNNQYIVITDEEKSYLEIIVNLEDNQEFRIISKNVVEKPNSFFKNAFDKKNYHKDFIGYNSSFFKDGTKVAKGGTTYFVLVDSSGKKYGESLLSTLVSPNPIDDELYSYLLKRLINNKKGNGG